MTVLIVLPFSAYAEGATVSRRDGFLSIWQTIRRPAYETRASYSDVAESDSGYLEISYGKRRGILDDDEQFHPDDLLTRHDALLWIYRTRNVAELPDMQPKNMPSMQSKYPVVSADVDLLSLVESEQELQRWMNDLDEQLKVEVHETSFYAEDFQGSGTAFGETFDMNALTAAHRSLPQDTLVHVTNVANDKSVVVRINDRGPYVHGRDMDLSLAAFETIATRSNGIIQARYERLGDQELVENTSEIIPITDEEKAEIRQPEVEQIERTTCRVPFGDRYQKRITRESHFNRGVPHRLPFGDTLTLSSTKFFVVRSVTYPDGNTARLQRWVNPKENEKYNFRASALGKYSFNIGTGYGRSRVMQMDVVGCE